MSTNMNQLRYDYGPLPLGGDQYEGYNVHPVEHKIRREIVEHGSTISDRAVQDILEDHGLSREITFSDTSEMLGKGRDVLEGNTDDDYYWYHIVIGTDLGSARESDKYDLQHLGREIDDIREIDSTHITAGGKLPRIPFLPNTAVDGVLEDMFEEPERIEDVLDITLPETFLCSVKTSGYRNNVDSVYPMIPTSDQDEIATCGCHANIFMNTFSGGGGHHLLCKHEAAVLMAYGDNRVDLDHSYLTSPRYALLFR